jgi:hypothetical protein
MLSVERSTLPKNEGINKMKDTREQDVKAEEKASKAEQEKGEIVVVRKADGTHTATQGKKSHTTRRIAPDFWD